MPLKEIARELQGKAANLALRMPIAWINILAGPPVAVDGRTLDGRTQWLLQLLARSGQPPIEQTTVMEARAGYDVFMLDDGRPRRRRSARWSIAPSQAPAGRLRIRIYRPAGTVARLLPAILYFHGGGWVMGSLEGYDLVYRYLLRPRRLRAWSPSTTAWRPSTSSPPASTTPSPPIAGCRPRRRTWASIRRASSSRAIRPAATSPPWPPSFCATRRARPACNG